MRIVTLDETPGFRVGITPPSAGTGDLRFERVAGRTSLTRALAVSPLKVLNPRHAGTSCWVYLATYGGGLVGGDAITIHVEVGPAAAAMLATQASTKVYRSTRLAAQTLDADVADEGLLALLPDPVSCFAHARYRQEQRIRLAPRASLLLVDRLTAGRVASGERWLFDEYTARTLVWRGDRLLLHDGLALAPDTVAGLGRFDALALIVMLGPAFAATAARLIGAIGRAPVPRHADVLLSAAPLGGEGAIVRIASRSIEQLGALVRQHLSVATALLGDDPWTGK